MAQVRGYLNDKKNGLSTSISSNERASVLALDSGSINKKLLMQNKKQICFCLCYTDFWKIGNGNL